jgi:16S rRNA processing protein RimM
METPSFSFPGGCMETIKIGTIVKPHGVRGELKVYSSSDFIMDRLKKNAVVILEKNGKKTEMKVTASRMQQDMALVKFEGVDSMNDAELWRDADVLVDRSRIPALKENDLYGRKVCIEIKPPLDLLVIEISNGG